MYQSKAGRTFSILTVYKTMVLQVTVSQVFKSDMFYQEKLLWAQCELNRKSVINTNNG